MEKIRIGVLGCSAIAERSILPTLSLAPEYKLAAVASRSEIKGKLIGEKYRCRYHDYEGIIGASDIDAIYVSLPVSLHYAWGRKVLESGKHLLLEKTFTDNILKAEELTTMARKARLVAMEALVYVYHPLYQNVVELINGGEIGEIRHIEAFFGFPFLPEDNIRNSRDLGGGALLDALVYPLSFTLNVSGEPHLRYSSNVLFDKKDQIDSRGFLQIDWKEYSAHIAYGFGFMYRNVYSVWGDKGYLSVDRAFSRPPDLKGIITIHKESGFNEIEVPPADHFSRMLSAFAAKIYGEDESGLNESENILCRMRLISDLYSESYRRFLPR